MDALHEQSVKIALDYLERTGVCAADAAFDYVGRHVAYQIEQGEGSRLKLSNRAISAFMRHRDNAPLRVIGQSS
ncbi:hypothetical protein [Tardiphaga sp.]|jgi:hypothetical protein|uniref:hypothetical protein n=1 Tax=Tardiphaga sp. TaxID=1926292 RepID=UPI0037DA1DB9